MLPGRTCCPHCPIAAARRTPLLPGALLAGGALIGLNPSPLTTILLMVRVLQLHRLGHKKPGGSLGVAQPADQGSASGGRRVREAGGIRAAGLWGGSILAGACAGPPGGRVLPPIQRQMRR